MTQKDNQVFIIKINKTGFVLFCLFFMPIVFLVGAMMYKGYYNPMYIMDGVDYVITAKVIPETAETHTYRYGYDTEYDSICRLSGSKRCYTSYMAHANVKVFTIEIDGGGIFGMVVPTRVDFKGYEKVRCNMNGIYYPHLSRSKHPAWLECQLVSDEFKIPAIHQCRKKTKKGIVSVCPDWRQNTRI